MSRLMVVILTLAAAGLAGCATDVEPPTGARVIDIEVSRYRFDPGTSFALNLTEGETVILRLTSTDVTHGFKIIEYNIDVEIPPGQTVEIRLDADKVGEFQIFCTVFCGVGHPQHKGTLHVS